MVKKNLCNMIGLKEEAGWKNEYMCRNKSRVNVDHAPIISTIFQIPLISTKIVRKNIYMN